VKVILAAMADYANQTGEGKLNIIGLFGQVNWTGPDSTVPIMSVVFVLEPDEDDYGQVRHLALKFQSPDGTEFLQPLRSQTTVPPRPDVGRILLNQQITLVATAFPVSGMHAFVLEMDDRAIYRLEFPVIDVRGG
jgi:hypothetical protein